MTTPYSICLVTVEDKKAAAAIASALVEEKLAACVSAVPGLSSTYRWKGKIERTQEILLIIKTRKLLRENVMQTVRREHPSSVPEILFLDIEKGSKEYLNWLGANTLFTANIAKDRPENP